LKIHVEPPENPSSVNIGFSGTLVGGSEKFYGQTRGALPVVSKLPLRRGVVEARGKSSNQLFAVLEEWTKLLKGSSIDFLPHPA